MSAECLGTLWHHLSCYGSRTLSKGSQNIAIDFAPPVVLDDEAVVLRRDQTSDFDGLRSRHGQAAAVLWSMT